jgi:hypothetical protein
VFEGTETVADVMPEGLDAPKDREFAGTESVAELAPDGGPPDNPLKAEDVPGSDMVCFASPNLIIGRV